MTEYAPETMEATWRRPVLAFTILFAIGAPWSIAIAETSVVGLAIVVLLGALLRRIPTSPIPWTLILVLTFLFFQALSIPLGEHPTRSLRCFRGSWVFLFPFVFWPVLTDPSIRRPALAAIGTSGALAGLYGIVQHFQGIDWLHGGRALENYGGGAFVSVGNLSSHLTYAGVLLPIFFLALGSAMTSRGRSRALWSIALVLMGLALVFSFTRSAWVGFGVGLVLFGLMMGTRPALLALGVLVAICGVAAAVEPALARRLVSILDVQDSERWRLWQSALRIVADHPWTGAGLGSFKTLFPVYKVPGNYFSTIHPHNDFLNHLVEAGVLGAAAWLGIWIAFFAEARRRTNARATALIAAMGAMLVAGLAQCYSTDEEVAQVWWFLAIAGLHEAGRTTRGSRAPLRQMARMFKARSLPLAARLFARGARNPEVTEIGEPRRILIVRPDQRLGNLLLLSPFLAALRLRFPTAHIGMVIGDAYAALLEDWPWIDEWFVQRKRVHARNPWRFWAWARNLRRAGWDVAFEMSNHNTHSYYSCLLTLISGAKTRIGFAEPRNADALTHSVPVPDPELPFALAPLALLSMFGDGYAKDRVPSGVVALSCPMRRPPSVTLDAWRRTAPESYGVVHLGGRGGKAWPLSAWSALLPELNARLPIVLVAGPDELDRLEDVRRLPGVFVAPQLSLVDLTHFLRDARLYVGCDSGAMHLAAAVATPVIGLFFRSNPYHYAPLGTQHALILLANPYGVDPTRWNRPLAAGGRARLFRADLPLRDSEDDRARTDAGRAIARTGTEADRTRTGTEADHPRTGTEARRVILAAVDWVLTSAPGASSVGHPRRGADGIRPEAFSTFDPRKEA